jgi:L-tartrate/succinate antiporter
MGPLSRREIMLAILVLIALGLWVFADDYVNPTTAALMVIALMLVTKVVSWDDMLANKQAWNTLAWFATLVTLADGLSRTGFVKWFATTISGHMTGFPPTTAAIVLVLIFFFTHYMFASVTAHATAMLPVMLAVGSTIPGMPMEAFALMLSLTLGIMGILTSYGTGPSPVYFGSGYLPAADFWRLGLIFGVVYIAVFVLICAPILL